MRAKCIPSEWNLNEKFINKIKYLFYSTNKLSLEYMANLDLNTKCIKEKHINEKFINIFHCTRIIK